MFVLHLQHPFHILRPDLSLSGRFQHRCHHPHLVAQKPAAFKDEMDDIPVLQDLQPADRTYQALFRVVVAVGETREIMSSHQVLRRFPHPGHIRSSWPEPAVPVREGVGLYGAHPVIIAFFHRGKPGMKRLRNLTHIQDPDVRRQQGVQSPLIIHAVPGVKVKHLPGGMHSGVGATAGRDGHGHSGNLLQRLFDHLLDAGGIDLPLPPRIPGAVILNPGLESGHQSTAMAMQPASTQAAETMPAMSTPVIFSTLYRVRGRWGS